MNALRADRIAKLNDAVRTTLKGGTICLMAGINALADDHKSRVLEAVQSFDKFTPDNDPHLEHDCGVVEVEGVSVIWKFDYLDPTFSLHSDDPADAAATCRVLTIMRADEY